MHTYEIRPQNRNEQLTAVVEATLPISEIGPWLGRHYGTIAGVLAARGQVPAGPPFARYHPETDDRFRVEAGFPVAAAIDPVDDVHPSTLPGGPMAETMHIGPYDAIEPAYGALASWVHEHDGELAGDAWEIYFTSPAEHPDPATWRTEIVQPYKIH